MSRGRIIAGAMALLLAAAAQPALSQTAAPAKKPAPAAAAPAPAATPAPSAAQKAQQDKMKSCASEWQGMKKAGKTKGLTYKQFSSECLKKS